MTGRSRLTLRSKLSPLTLRVEICAGLRAANGPQSLCNRPCAHRVRGFLIAGFFEEERLEMAGVAVKKLESDVMLVTPRLRRFR